ncbi:MAG: glucose-6-phosphate dehydrogenase, partial [Opitutales bacterium]
MIVIFGASGDLTARKLMPALYNLAADNLLPTNFFFIGYGRRELTDDAFRSSMKEAVEKFSRRATDEKIWENLSQGIHFQVGGYDDEASYRRLRDTIDNIEQDSHREFQALFYVSTPPSAFAPVLRNLGLCGLAQRGSGSRLASKVVIEKPFGRDWESARQLNEVITRHFDENQVFRIDHYLGKETVQSLLVQRFANSIFEPIWNRRYVDCVQITVSESIGVGSRAGYYDQSGALRDMIQNHVMQLLALTAMEPPVSLDPESIRDEKVKVLKAIQPICLVEGSADIVRGRYVEGLVDGEKKRGYM